MVEGHDANRALVPTASSQQAVSTKGFDHGERELRDLRNIVLVADDDVTVKQLRDILGWSKIAGGA